MLCLCPCLPAKINVLVRNAALLWVVCLSDFQVRHTRFLLINKIYKYNGDRGSTVVKVLCYKSEGRWFDPRWCNWIFH